MKTRFKLW